MRSTVDTSSQHGPQGRLAKRCFWLVDVSYTERGSEYETELEIHGYLKDLSSET